MKYNIEPLQEGHRLTWRKNDIFLRLDLDVDKLIDIYIFNHITKIKALISLFHSDNFLTLTENNLGKQIILHAIYQNPNIYIDERILTAYNFIEGTKISWQLYISFFYNT